MPPLNVQTSMNQILIRPLAAIVLAALAGSVVAQDKNEAVSPAAPAKVELNEHEKKFEASLKNAVFVGRWCLVKDGKMGEAKAETYTIHNAKKVNDRQWIISSRMQWGKKDITVPIPVNVLWAGDTPVITLDKLWIPGAGTYSARVMVFEDTYAGTWSGPNYGGLLNGVVTHPKTK